MTQKKGTRVGQGFVRQFKEEKGLTIVYIVLRIAVVGVLVAQALNKNYYDVFLCVLTLVLFTLPGLVERKFRIDVPNTLEIIILLFIFAAEILGEIRSFYLTFPFWDTMLHTINGFMCAAIGFALVDILNRSDRVTLELSPFFMAVVAFCFSMTIGVLWEFFEYGMDVFFHMDMQKDTVLNAITSVMLNPDGANAAVTINGIEDVIVVANGKQISLGLGGYLDIGLWDTMKDMLVNFVGAVVFSVIGFFYVKSRGKGKFVRRFILRRIAEPAETEGQKETCPKLPRDRRKGKR